AFDWSRNEKLIAVATGSPTFRVYDIGTGQVISLLRMPKAAPGDGDWLRINWTVFSPDSQRLLAIGNYLSTARVFDVRTERELFVLRGHVLRRGLIVDAAFSPDGSRIVTGAQDGQAIVWDAYSGQLLKVLKPPDAAVVKHVQFSPDGRRILTAARKVHLWDA